MVVRVSRLRVLASSAALCAAAFAVPAGATTPINGSLNLVANATLGANTLSQPSTSSWWNVPGSLSGSASASQSFNGDTVSATDTGSAAWASADAGTVDFRNAGWNFSVVSGADSSADLFTGRGGDDWSYTFTASGNGVISLSYDESLASGNGFGLQGWSVDFTGSGSGAPTLSAASPDQTGLFTGALLAGQTYTIGLADNANIAFGGPSGDYGGHMNGVFGWKITYDGVPGVPEPSTWAMMLLGVGLLGAAMRMRRSREGTAAAA